MSEIKANKIQAGISLTPANNFVLDASADDGTVVLKRADGTVVLQVDASGNLIGKSADTVDATVNRLLQVGDFGLGSTACPTISDANDAVLSGIYAGPGGAGVNFPGSTKYGVLFVGTRTGTIVMQVAVYSTEVYKRRSVDGGATWESWTLMYDQKTILGTVSQSSGVPTGAIIESGSNANGFYTKFADGTLVCTFHEDIGSTSIGPQAYLGIGYRNFPALMKDVDGLGMSYALETGYGYDHHFISEGQAYNSWGTMYIRNLGDATRTTNRHIYLMAIGRWF